MSLGTGARVADAPKKGLVPFVVSLLFQILFLAAVIIVPLFFIEAITPKKVEVISLVTDLSPYRLEFPGGGGGGGEHNLIPASKGKLPKFNWRQFAAPKVRTDPDAKLKMEATVLGPPDILLPSPNTPNYGDPLAKLLNDSSGPGGGDGIGSTCCGGVGSGNGRGVGPGSDEGIGGGEYRAGQNGVGKPECLDCPKPFYTDEAQKAKTQGLVVLDVLVTVDGRVVDIKLVQGAGLGLDEKAIEAVKTWRFKPAIGPHGKPVAARVSVEVNFHLL